MITQALMGFRVETPMRLWVAIAVERFHWTLKQTLETDYADFMWLMNTIAEIDRIRNEKDE